MSNVSVITEFNNSRTFINFIDGKAFEIIREDPSRSYDIGDIIVGVVDSVRENLNACFIKISGTENAFISFDDIDECKKIKPGDLIPVKIKSLPQKKKGATVTEKLSIPGKFTVLMQGNGTGFSKKLSRQAIENINENIKVPEGCFVLFRTACENASLSEIKDEINDRKEILDRVILYGKERTPYSVLYKAPDIIFSRLRNIKPDKIITDDKETYDEIISFDGSFKDITEFYDDRKAPLSVLYKFESAINDATNRKVNLNSGGYLIIDPTEAMTVVDVNSGKFSLNKDKKEASLKINKEACDELRRQMYLRNLSGMIIVDFINMDKDGEEEVMGYLRSILKDDHVATKVLGFTRLGLMEITREKTYKSL